MISVVGIEPHYSTVNSSAKAREQFIAPVAWEDVTEKAEAEKKPSTTAKKKTKK